MAASTSNEPNDVWSEDPEFGRDEWAQDARDGDTNMGYWDWVEHRRKFYKENPQYNCFR